MSRVLFPALLGLLLTACASTSTVRSMNVRPLAVQDIDLKGCGMTLTQPAGGTFFVADAQGAARIRLGDERVKLSRQQASGVSLPGGQQEVQLFADPTGQVQVKVQLSVAGAAHAGRQSVLAQLEVDTPSGFNLLNMAGETGC
ncbi:hypothetical protein A9J41_12840 [Laribacter hongkongensis]|uniref:hypothetical protein n=1 Tax=Laribacter hongkongensis TaxID=168471 RepID=UPI0018786AAB|nr:hypothetical protein [Laribacter hongkongensis]MBE5528391.1 hypothetical protein [Laribacter hongkongensis]